ncbi:MAG: tetratricopeptide repeat protein, partial [Elainellaceae cyanobacterium]
CQLNRRRSLETTQRLSPSLRDSRDRVIQRCGSSSLRPLPGREPGRSTPPISRSEGYARRETEPGRRSGNSRRVKPQAQDADFEAALRKQALSEARQGNYDLAIAIYDELINCNPNNASDYNNRGLAYFQASQYDEAIANYNRAIELNPDLDSVYNNRANYYACRGLLLEAILDYDIAIDLNPSNVRAWINQGITFRELKMYERAIECFDAALTFEKLEGNIYAERGRTYHLWGDWNSAVANYIWAIEDLPISTSTLYTASGRLRLQVELWLDDLMAPLTDAAE